VPERTPLAPLFVRPAAPVINNVNNAMENTMSKLQWPARAVLRSNAQDRANAELIARHMLAQGRIFVSISDVLREALQAAAEKAKG
jgi:hypothetical protein